MGTNTYNRIAEYYEPVDSLASDILESTEMTRSQLGFLCGLIRDSRPEKIVEVGVAAGGTTAVLLNCINYLGFDAVLYSVDLNICLYNDKGKETGYKAKEFYHDNALSSNHEILLGKYLPEVLDKIGEDIDFIILDTVHFLPGELFDFLAAFPYLRDGAIVVMHDTALSHYEECYDRHCLSTGILYACVAAEKFINNQIEFPNIAALRLNEDTKKYIVNIFSALNLPWEYFPDEKEIAIYKNWYQNFYTEDLNLLFMQAVEANKKTHRRPDEGTRLYLRSIKESILKGYSNIYVYGAGKRGKCLKKAMLDIDCWEDGNYRYVVSQNGGMPGRNEMFFEKIESDKEQTLFILATAAREVKEKLLLSDWHWLEIPDTVWVVLEEVYGE